MINRLRIILKNLVYAIVLVSTLLTPQASAWSIYLDSDRSHHLSSALAIEMGVKTAFSMAGQASVWEKVKFITTDHRGNTVRSKRNMSTFLDDPEGLVFFAGLHSPPLIRYRDWINDHQLLCMVPWAAGAPITRAATENNWIFRLSIDDSKVGDFLAKKASESGTLNQTHLLLEDTPWGKTNFRNLSISLAEVTSTPPQVSWFSWGISKTTASLISEKISSSDIDALFFVGNSNEGSLLLNQLSDQNFKKPIFSHWGITGGDFMKKVGSNVHHLDLRIVQTSFSFYDLKHHPFATTVFQHAQTLFPHLKSVQDLDASTGFIHGFDLALLLIQAMKECNHHAPKLELQQQLKDKLEHLNQPIQGLIKTYQQPFRPYRLDDPDAHEALNQKDFRLGKYHQDGSLRIIKP